MTTLFDPIDKSRPSKSLFPLRENEPEYARLNDEPTQENNRYGASISLQSLIEQASLNINGVKETGFSPNRNKQHAFHFTADNCIGCHACESACSEKNDLPAHMSFRSVGYVEGGSYPNYTRMNISMACNHCDDPVCLKGCPTRAYTKHPEYGAVIQDPDICFGCGYCTWVCPYNAPQLDPVAGQVEKCNMCVDRLEVGLKPACVAACLGNALDFGVVENTPEGRQQTETSIPGFPDATITRPNIRFQQTKSMPQEVTRTDSMPVKYRRNSNTGQYQPTVDSKSGMTKHWNIVRLSSRENPLVVFTLATQSAIGLLLILFAGGSLGIAPLRIIMDAAVYPLVLFVSLGLMSLGLLMSVSHLGKPWRFYRGFNNLRHSPVAREGLGMVCFMLFVGLHLLFVLLTQALHYESIQAFLSESVDLSALQSFVVLATSLLGTLAIVAGLIALYYMILCYRIKARPFWNHWQTGAAFVGSMLHLGAIGVWVIGTPILLLLEQPISSLLMVSAAVMLVGLLLEGFGLLRHARDMRLTDSEAAVSHYVQCTTFGKTYVLRNILMCLNILLLATISLGAVTSTVALTLMAVLSVSGILIALIGRALFYVLVIPTTMPGTFFWKNKGFEEHARDIGLAKRPQVGVATHRH